MTAAMFMKFAPIVFAVGLFSLFMAIRQKRITISPRALPWVELVIGVMIVSGFAIVRGMTFEQIADIFGMGSSVFVGTWLTSAFGTAPPALPPSSTPPTP